MFAVSGLSTSFYYEIAQSRNVTTLGSMQGDNSPASICSNGSGGNQNMIVSGGLGYIHDLASNAFVQITDGEFLTPSVMAMYFETYFLNLQRGTNTFQLSAQLDGLNWNGLDTGQCSLTSDQKFAMALLSRTLFFAGNKNIEPWYNSGNASFPIQPESGVVVEHGILAPFSFANLDNTLYWLGQDATGKISCGGSTATRSASPRIRLKTSSAVGASAGFIGFCFQTGTSSTPSTANNDYWSLTARSISGWISQWDVHCCGIVRGRCAARRQGGMACFSAAAIRR
jgi:hypothetical protein